MDKMKEEEIGEMAEILVSACVDQEPCPVGCEKCHAEKLYNAGYRKASDVARKIFGEINELKDEYARGDIDGNALYVGLYQLEKKYIGEKEK